MLGGSATALIRVLSAASVAISLGLLLIACGDDDDAQPDPIPVTDYYENIQRVNEEAAGEIRHISAEAAGPDRYDAAANVFSTLADGTEEFDPAFETVGVHEAYIFTARLMSDTLVAAATGDEAALDRLPSLIDDFEFVCRGFVDVARAIFSEGRELDCTYASTLIE